MLWYVSKQSSNLSSEKKHFLEVNENSSPFSRSSLFELVVDECELVVDECELVVDECALVVDECELVVDECELVDECVFDFLQKVCTSGVVEGHKLLEVFRRNHLRHGASANVKNLKQ